MKLLLTKIIEVRTQEAVKLHEIPYFSPRLMSSCQKRGGSGGAELLKHTEKGCRFLRRALASLRRPSGKKVKFEGINGRYQTHIDLKEFLTPYGALFFTIF